MEFLSENFSRPTDYGVGDVDGKGCSSLSQKREELDTKKAQEQKGWNGRPPIRERIPWKWIVGGLLVYYFFVKK